MLGKAGVVVLDAGLFEALGQIHGVLAVLLHADMQGVQVLLDARGAEGVEHGTQQHGGAGVHVNQGVDVFGGTADGAGHAVVHAVHILGHAVDHHVCAQTVGRENHRGEGVVDQQFGAGGVGNLRQLGKVGDTQQRVVHRLGVEHLGVRTDGLLHGVEVLHVHESDIHVEFLEVVVQEGEGAAVGGHAGDDVVAALHLVQQGDGDGGHAGTGRPGQLSAFDGGQ